MRPIGTVRALGCALAFLAVAAGPSASAQTLTVALTPATAPATNALVQNQIASIFYDVTNLRSGTTVNQIDFTAPANNVFITGGSGPPGWIVVSSSYTTIRFRVATCGQGGLGLNAKGTFRIDAYAWPASNQDTSTTLGGVTPADPCGGTGGWTTSTNIPVPIEMLSVSASATPTSGGAPLTTTATFNVTNNATVSKSLSISIAVTPTSGVGTTSCSPASLSLASNASGTFTCTIVLNPSALTSYTIGGTLSGSRVSNGAIAGPVLVGPATATFAFDNLSATTNDVVRATFSVKNNTAAPMDVTPPTYAQLALANLAKASGATDPAAVTGLAAGATQAFVYQLAVTGGIGASYVASGTASVTGGSTNLATTPAGTVAGWRVTWMQNAVVPSRQAAPYRFTVTVTNLSSVTLTEIDVWNPQRGTWTGLANVSATGMTYRGNGTFNSTDYLYYTGSLAQNQTATFTFSFSAVPAVTATTSYPFQVVVYGPGGGGGPVGGGGMLGSVTKTVADTFPIGEVGSFSILSNATGQTLYWTNTSRSDEVHDGVVVFRVAAPAVPPSPADFVDYTVPANQPAGFLYADKNGSAAATLSDPAVGAYNYRICNHDANLVYSGCNSGFWNSAGWLDSAVAPVGGWAHQLGGAIFLQPGILPGSRVGVATNAPAEAVLDATTGSRSFGPTALAALPARGSLGLSLGNGKQVVYDADQSGQITAIDALTGASYWTATKAGEAFVGGLNAVLRRYGSAAFQAAYSSDILLVGSTTGRLLCMDATTGVTLWTVNAGAAIRTLGLYDYGKNWFYAATDTGIVAFDLGTSSQTVAPSVPSGWVNPGGAYTLGCTPAPSAGQIACVDRTGPVRVLNQSTGAILTSYSSGLTSSSRLWCDPNGCVVSNASAVKRLLISGTAITLGGTWSPGLTLAPVLVFPTTGFIYVGASDFKLHKLNLANASDTGLFAAVSSQAAGTLMASPAFDVRTSLFVFGTSDGRLWGVKSF